MHEPARLTTKTHPVLRTAQRKPDVCCDAEIHGYGPHIIGVHTCHQGWNLALALVIHAIISSRAKRDRVLTANNRLKYAQMVPLYLAAMHSLKESDPDI